MENKEKTYFNINASKYVQGKNFDFVRPGFACVRIMPINSKT